MRPITFIHLGIGTVGGAVVEQTIANRERWRRSFGLDVRVGALVGREDALVAEGDELPDDDAMSVVAARRGGTGWRDLELGRATLDLPRAVLERFAAAGPTIVLDAAAGEDTAALDARAIELGAGVVLSNKAPLAMPLANPTSAALCAAATPRRRLRYEATCGAGLPVISTLRALLDTGDRVREIRGMLSGTLGAIFSDVAAGRSFSEAVRTAKERGYTEPDPRDDLSGLDVARKALILARTIGRWVDLDEIAVENLVPEELQTGSVQEFLARVGEADAPMADRGAQASASGKVLKYVAAVTPDAPLAVGVQAIETVGVLGTLQGPENIISIRTERYDAYPLNVTGPGAGAAVTAAGMLADALALALTR